MTVQKCILIILCIFAVQPCLCFATVRPTLLKGLAKRSENEKHVRLSRFTCRQQVSVNPINIITTGSSRTVFADALGYVMGIGAISVYAPILLKVVKKQDIEGLSITTWIFNVLGYAMSVAYPMKKGFPFSTYIEIVGAGLQSLVILGLLCKYNQNELPFLVGVAVIAAGFYAFMRAPSLNPKLIGSVQILASLFANYANVPQILVTFQRKKASWSAITALLSLAGCTVRVFTTMQLTKDSLLVGGYILGLITNGLLLAQVILYRNAK
ncbi:hypothetical protein EON65_28805 [archaeon]|nr:MAG: hypothetical protein EON65_28805 [archaeon]